MEELSYTSKFEGETTDKILDNAKAIMEQTAAEDGETVQVYDTNGVPHKVAKTELLKKSALALPKLENISSFVAVNAAGNAIGLMTKEQVASVLAGLMGINTLKSAFQFNGFSLKKGETASIGKVGGLMVIRHSWSSSDLAIVYVDNYAKKITQIAGRDYAAMSFEVSWEGSGYDTVMKITSTYGGNSGNSTAFFVAWQSIYG